MADPDTAPMGASSPPEPGTTRQSVRGWRAAAVVAGTGLAYLLAGWAALSLAGGPGVASPLFPPAGIALAAVLSFGRWALPGVWLGSMSLNVLAGAQASGVALGVMLPGLIGLGALSQAWAGAVLAQRFCIHPLVLQAPRDILRAGLLAALLACTVSASVATVALFAFGILTAGEMPANWATWWLGDTLGVLIAAPLALTLVGHPAAEWRPRRLTVGAPLLVAFALMVLVIHEARTLETGRQHASFERDAERLAAEARARLLVPMHALQAVHGSFRVQGGDPSAASLREAARWWLESPLPLRALGYSPRVPAEGLAAFVESIRRSGEPEFRIFHGDDGRALANDREAVVLRLVEPRTANAAAAGVNALSIPEARAAILKAAGRGDVAATPGFVLTQGQDAREVGVVMYRALYRGEPADAAQRMRDWRGVVFVTISLERALAALVPAALGHLNWCLLDPGAAEGSRRLAGTAGCEAMPDARRLVARHPVMLADRSFELRIDADAERVPGGERGQTVLIGFGAMAAAAMLGALLLTVTGQSRRTQIEVDVATAELRHEIDERSQAQAALRDREQLLRSVLNAVPIGVLVLTAKGRVLDANPRLESMFGLTPEALRSMPFGALIDPSDHARAITEQQGLLQGHSSIARVRLKLRRGDGSDFPAMVAAVALRDAHGQVQRFVAVLEDITEQLRLEASSRELERVEAASRAKTEFLSRMSHELRTPLNAMIGFAQLLGLDRNPALSSSQADWARQIQKAGWHLLEMINETLDLARIESGSVKLSPESIVLPAMLAGCHALVEGAARSRNIEWREQVLPGAERVLADPTRLKQVLTNLLSNAVKYNRDRGQVQVLARPDPSGEVVIEVRDTGPGLTPEQLGQLFQPYNRLGREHSGIEGTGIGLVISRRLAGLMGGRLDASSEPGVGTCFELRLPAARDDVASIEAEPAPTALTYSRRLVHYVEDNETNIEVMRGILLQRPQIELGVTMLGLDALSAIRSAQPQLILLDMHLPDISGLELLRHLKGDPAIAGIPVIVVSADATTQRIQEALTLGAAHYVTKPIELRRFLGMVDEVLEGLETRWM